MTVFFHVFFLQVRQKICSQKCDFYLKVDNIQSLSEKKLSVMNQKSCINISE